MTTRANKKETLLDSVGETLKLSPDVIELIEIADGAAPSEATDNTKPIYEIVKMGETTVNYYDDLTELLGETEMTRAEILAYTEDVLASKISQHRENIASMKKLEGEDASNKRTEKRRQETQRKGLAAYETALANAKRNREIWEKSMEDLHTAVWQLLITYRNDAKEMAAIWAKPLGKYKKDEILQWYPAKYRDAFASGQDPFLKTFVEADAIREAERKPTNDKRAATKAAKEAAKAAASK